jgi:hypothetical protein
VKQCFTLFSLELFNNKEDRVLNICVNVEEQSREAEEWMILAAMAVWEADSYKVLHYKILLEKSKVRRSLFNFLSGDRDVTCKHTPDSFLLCPIIKLKLIILI